MNLLWSFFQKKSTIGRNLSQRKPLVGFNQKYRALNMNAG
jgi:hypothetical protein